MIVLVAVLCLLALGCGGSADATRPPPPTGFSGAAAFEYARAQLAFGPRVPGTPGWQQAGDWLVATLRARADTVIEQRWNHSLSSGGTIPQRNILARFRPEVSERVLYVAHWDTRPVSDAAEDSLQRATPVPGANDNAAGVGLLIAVADVLRRTPPAYGVDLLFVDGEDYGNFEAMTDVLIGSTYFAAHPPDSAYAPLFGVVWDMIGDRDLRILQEGHSLDAAPEVVARVWNRAADRGLSAVFSPDAGVGINDDHVSFIRVGWRVIDVIDFDYPYHHRPSDTLDKISPQSLQSVGDVAVSLLLTR